MDIKKLLKPNKVAVIGASEKEGFGGDTCRNMIAYMEEGKYFFVNPKREQVLGKKCYASIASLPEQVDLLVIATPEGTVEEMLREGAEKGVKAAVVYASGYGEIGTEVGRGKEAKLKALSEELDIAIMGPNCAGYVNFIDKVYPFAFISDERDRTGAVGVISQSGQLVLSMLDNPALKFSYTISAGNSKIIEIEDYLDFLIEDEETKVIAMYMEGVKNPESFVRGLKKAALKHKPIVILKTGRSEKAQALAASHTGSLSGADKVYDALFEKFGVIRTDDLQELMSTAQALATLKKLPLGEGLSSISLSGGETAICADLGELTGLSYKDFTAETLEKLKNLLPSYATPNNPLDSTTTLSYDIEKFSKVLEIVMKDPGVSMVSVGYTLLQEIADNAIFYMSEAMERVSKEEWVKPMVMVPFAEQTRNREYFDRLEKIGVPVMPTALYAYKVMKNIFDFSKYKVDNHNLDVQFPNPGGSDVKSEAMSESESKAIINQFHVPTGKTEVAHTAEEAVRLFYEFGGLPVVAKIDSPDILHKSDMGCVKLKLDSEEDVRKAYDEILDNAKTHCPDARVNGIQICEMVKSGVEMIIGVNNDPQFGPCVLCGLGGVFVEIFKDTSLGMAPLSKTEARKMVTSLKGVKMLQGYRGSKACDMDAFIEAIVNISNLACAHCDSMAELDINPVFVYEKGICAVDALYIKKVGYMEAE